MFKVTKKSEFTHEVKVMTPVDGGHKEETFKARFRVVGEGEYSEREIVTSAGMKNFLRTALVHCEDLVDEAEKPLEWNDELRDQMLDASFVRLALMKTYSTAVTKLRSGN